MTQSSFDKKPCSGTYGLGHVTFQGKAEGIQHATITMGTRTFVDLLRTPESACDVNTASRSPTSLIYFTCSGSAVIQTVNDRWFKAVWIHRYDPSMCDKPCWMAAHEPLPVTLTMTEIAGPE